MAAVERVRSLHVARLTLGALGIVFGDIATSPLYALQAAFDEHGVRPTSGNVLGVLSLTLWSLILVVSVKYAVFILRADNRGEGGSTALLALAREAVASYPLLRRIVVVLGLIGIALFFGDSVITPAISVLSAIEGLDVATPTLHPVIVPVSVSVLVGLFALQRFGSGVVGSLFGPVMMVWLLTIALLGIASIAQEPSVLRAIDPSYAVSYFARSGLAGFLSLGAVVLVLTGVEALYADLGHFGIRPIRTAWFVFVLPALLCNYFGQGALLLQNPAASNLPFYSLVPKALLYPMVGLACLATIIASQAVIAGAFSMVREAVLLGFLPRMRVLQTSAKVRGQIYLPSLNLILFVLVVSATVGFGSSDDLAAAFGFAVSGTMLISTLLVLVVARNVWHWAFGKIVLFGIAFGSIDLAFFGANAAKLESGGWFPLVLGTIVFVLMTTWRQGRRLMLERIGKDGVPLESFIQSLASHLPIRVPGLAVFLTANAAVAPQALLHNLKHNKILHEKNVILTTETIDRPRATDEERITLSELDHGFYRLVLRLGFADNPNLPEFLEERRCAALNFDPMTTTYFVSRETVVSTAGEGMWRWREKLFAFLAHNSERATAYFCLPVNRLVEIGSRVEI